MSLKKDGVFALLSILLPCTIARICPRISKGIYSFCLLSRSLCSRKYTVDDVDKGIDSIEHYLNESWKNSNFEVEEEDKSAFIDLRNKGNVPLRQGFIEQSKCNAKRILEILDQDGPGVDAKPLLSEIDVKISGLVVREVLFGVLKMITYTNKNRCAKLGYKFFVWSSEQDNFRHTLNSYHIMMEIFAECEELKAMWKLVDEMTEKGYPTTARTFNILICTSGAAGLTRKVIEMFIKSKNLNYRPFKQSFNAILRSLLARDQYELIEWIYHQMLVEGHSPDILTYNIIMFAKIKLGKLDHFHGLLYEMGKNGFSPDLHTYNLLLHVLGKVDKPVAALKLLNYMNEIGIDPNVLHFTTLIDGLSRAGNLEASEYFFNEMINRGGVPDVVCYTVMVTGYVVAGRIDKAREIFNEMIKNGKLPNVYTYNSMIRGLCMVRKFREAESMLEEMESKGCNPNFLVYTTLVGYLRGAGKLAEAHNVIRIMLEKGRNVHLLHKIRTYRRS